MDEYVKALQFFHDLCADVESCPQCPLYDNTVCCALGRIPIYWDAEAIAAQYKEFEERSKQND